LLGSAANVATLGIQDDGHRWCHVSDVRDQTFELGFGAVRRKVSDLRLEGADHVVGSVHDGRAKIKNIRGILPQVGGKFTWFGVESHTQQGLVCVRGLGELL
jgi:hypothetical protein